MSLAAVLVATQLSLAPPSTEAPPPAPAGAPLASEWTVQAGAASSIRVFQSESGRHYLVQTVAWGRELTRGGGPGVLRGRFGWAIEAMPLFAQTSPSGAYGVGVSPVVWRWNFAPRPRWSAYAEMAFGGLFTSDAVPEGTRRANFMAHWGLGVRLRRTPSQAFVLAYRFQHLSNGNQSPENPGVNAHVALAGYSWSR